MGTPEIDLGPTLPWPKRQVASGPAGDSGTLRVFISSASGELARYRQAAIEVCHRLGLVPVHMEEFDPQRPMPEQVCRQKVEGSDVFVLLLAHRYGVRPPEQQFSYTELEYQWAMNRPHMPLLAFVVDPAFPWPPLDIDSGPDAEDLSAFMSEVRTGHVVRRFGELTTFREDLLLALSRQRHAVSLFKDSKTTEGEESRSALVPTPPVFHAKPSYVGGAPFTGRSGDLDVLDGWGRSAEPVLVVEAIGGTGKSALTWQWAQQRAPAAVSGLAGRLWWSFYEGPASMTRFLQELVAYTSGRPMKQVRRLKRAELADEALARLRDRPYLVVLDGFERLLAAYHRFDPSELRDEEVESGQRGLIEPQADEIVRGLTAAGPSKILISTRLMPTALQSRFGQQVPGVRYLRLPGLTDADTRALLARLGVHGGGSTIAGFFGPLGNHPLLIGIVAGLVADYRPEPGGFDRWLDDPTAGGALRVPGLDLSQRSTHILAAALDGLQPWPRRLLGWISVLPGTVSWGTLEGINPYQPQPPAPIEPDLTSLGPMPQPPNDEPFPLARKQLSQARERYRAWDQYQAKYIAWQNARMELIEQTRREQFATWQSSGQVARARTLLDVALKDLEDRGLLWWDRSSNSYDLHPIVRAYAYGQLETSERIQANDWIGDHFRALPVENPERAASVEDLKRTITLFRALVGAGHVSEAGAVWQTRLAKALLHNLGAHTTVVELLNPVAQDRRYLSIDLATSYWSMGRYNEAIRQETSILADTLREKEIVAVRFSLGNLSISLRDAGSIAAASRCCDLRAAINAAAGVKADGSLCLYHAMLAALKGQVAQAHELLNQAENLGPAGQGLWHGEHIQYWRFYMALKADRILTRTQIHGAISESCSWQHRLNLTALQYELFVQLKQFEQAMVAANQQERLSRNAGLDVAPARSAFLLAKLGRASEAGAAVEESLSRLPRIDPAQFPHYYLAQTLWELDRPDEAAAHAYQAYQQARCDGPPNCRHWDLRDARDLLQTMSKPVPDMPTTAPATATVPLEDEILAFIAALKTGRRRKRRS